MDHQSNFWFSSYVKLQVAWKCHSGTLGHSRSGSEKPKGTTRLHVIGSYRCVWPMLIWEHHQDWHGGGFWKVDSPMQDLHWRKLNKTLVYKIEAHWSHWAMKMWWRGPTRGNGMPIYQGSRWLIDPTYVFRVMSSCKLHENVDQGHLVTLGLGEKNQTEHQDCMPLPPTSVYVQFRYGNNTKTRTM